MLIPTASVSADIAVPRFQTAQAYGENLTCIGIQVINFDLFKYVLLWVVGEAVKFSSTNWKNE